MYRMLPKEQESRGVRREEGYPLNKTLTEHYYVPVPMLGIRNSEMNPIW